VTTRINSRGHLRAALAGTVIGMSVLLVWLAYVLTTPISTLAYLSHGG